MKNKLFPIPDIKEAREIPMETRMQMIEALLYSVALDAEEMSDAMDKLSFEGASTLTRTLKDEFGLEFRHILKRLFWGDYKQPHVKDFYFGLIPNAWLRQYQLASDMREQSRNNQHTLTYAGSTTNEQLQDSTPAQELKPSELKPSIYEVYAQNKRKGMLETGERVKVKDFYTQAILPGVFEIDHVDIVLHYDDEIRTYRVKNIETGELIEGLCWLEIESL